jgi:membrane associated rhomboid family serine protease
MASLWDKIKNAYLKGNSALRYIFILTGIFLLIRITYAILGMTGVDGSLLLNLLQLPAGIDGFLASPWTALTYMFVHFGLSHLLMNLFLLYFFGGLFIRWFNKSGFNVIFILGGLVGAAFFISGYLIFPGLSDAAGQSPLIGASASVMALCFAVTIYKPDENINLFMLGNIKLKYIAIILVALDMLSMSKVNSGVGLAHLGGGLSGLIYGFSARKGKDLFSWTKVLSFKISGIFKREPVMKVKYNRSGNEKANRADDADREFNKKKKADSERLDAILDKIKLSGYDSLSQEEKKELFDFSNKSV